MLLKAFVILTQYMIIFTQFEFIHAIIGEYNVRNVRSNEFPFIAAIITLYNDNEEIKFELQCSGTIITKKLVLTAAHCVEVKDVCDYRVMTQTVDLVIGSMYNVSWWITYNEWATGQEIDVNEDEDENDLAILQVNVPSLIATPDLFSDLSTAALSGLDMFLVGWKLLDFRQLGGSMRTGKVGLLDILECYQKTIHGDGLIVNFEDRFFCTAAETSILLDYGDSGAPVLYENKVVGINIGTCPSDEEHDQKVNFHISIHYYRHFIDFACSFF